MKRFCQLLESDWPPAALRATWCECLAREALEHLVRLRVLAPYTADRYPCPSPGGDQCPRVVQPSTTHGWLVAICGNDEPDCEMVVLEPDQLASWRLSVPDWLAALARAARVTTTRAASLPWPGVYCLGQRAPEDGGAWVFYVARPGRADLAIVLEGLLMQTQGGAVWCLVPTAARIDPALALASLARGLEFVVLEQSLASRDGALVLESPAPTTREVAPAPYCVAILRSGERTIGEADYRALCADEATFDLFVDGVGTNARCSRREPKGARRRDTLTPGELAILLGVVRAGGPVQPRRFMLGSSNGSALKMFECARKKVDVRVDDTWRAFTLARGAVPSQKAYHFAPPPDLNWCVLVKLPTERHAAR